MVADAGATHALRLDRFLRGVKRLAERTLGLSISRSRPTASDKHAYQTVARLRRWSPDDVVFDVGANDGRTVLRVNEPLSRPRIFAFEPVAATYRKLVERTAHLPNVRTFPLALGAAVGSAPIHVNEIDSMSSFVPSWTSGGTGEEEVRIATIDQVMAEQGIEFVHFLKIDTEGYELEVLRGAHRALARSAVAMVQLEVGVDQLPKQFLSLEEARRHLAPYGYRLQGVYNQCLSEARPPREWPPSETEGYRCKVLAYCDALFIRADL